MGSESNYFKACVGDSYTPFLFGFHEATHPTRVAEALESVRGTPAADIIASLVRDIEIRRQREIRLYGEWISKKGSEGEIVDGANKTQGVSFAYTNIPIKNWPARCLEWSSDEGFNSGFATGVGLCLLSLEGHMRAFPFKD